MRSTAPGAKERIDLDGLKPGESQGNVTATEDGYVAHVGITRIHMEEDAGKMVHIGGDEGRIAGATHSLVDYNRAGTPLIELVTEPDLRTPEEARLFMQKLRKSIWPLAFPTAPWRKAPCVATAMCRCVAAVLRAWA